MTFRVDPDKITLYLLNPSHPVGGPKSVFFSQVAGFSKASSADVQTFIDALIEHARSSQRTLTDTSSPYGAKNVYIGPIRSPNGRNPIITSIWQYRKGDWWFVTAYP